MISVIIPSWNRPELCQKTIMSFRQTSLSDDKVEYWVRTAWTEPQMSWYVWCDQKTQRFCSDHIGYENLHLSMNELAAKTVGDWIFCATDDIIMKTHNWDYLINSYDSSKPCVLNPCGHGLNLFPIVSRPFYDMLGHISRQCHYDTYISTVAHECGLQIRMNLDIEHNDGIFDATSKETSVQKLDTSKHYYSEEVQNWLKEDINKIKEKLNVKL